MSLSKDLYDLLQWEVEEEYITNFEKEKIRKLSVLRLLNETSLVKLFPEEGPRLEFKAHLEDYLLTDKEKEEKNQSGGDTSKTTLGGTASSSPTPPTTGNVNDDIIDIQDLPSANQSAPKRKTDNLDQSLTENDIWSDISTPITPPSHFEASTSQASTSQASSSQASTSQGNVKGKSSSRKRKYGDTRDVESILNETVDGQLALAYYREHGQLDESQRNIIADAILSSFLCDDLERSLPSDVESEMATDIVKLFPKEDQDIWSVPETKRHKAAGRGKLLNRYYNMRRKLSRSHLISKKVPSKSDGDVRSRSLPHTFDDNLTQAERDELHRKINWLQNNKVPWTNVELYWRETSKHRMKSYMGGLQPAHEYMDLYPALKLSDSGFLLLEIDFDTTYPDCGNKLFSEWPMLAAFISSKISVHDRDEIEESFTAEGRKVRTILALNKLFSVITAAKKGKKQWRPSRQESMQGLLEIVQTTADVLTAIAARRLKYESYNLQLGPQAVCVGQDEDHITASYVVVNQILYEVANPLKAVDVAFKCMHALDAHFPRESVREWTFLQRGVYGIIAKQDKADVKLCGLIDKYASFKETNRRN